MKINESQTCGLEKAARSVNRRESEPDAFQKLMDQMVAEKEPRPASARAGGQTLVTGGVQIQGEAFALMNPKPGGFGEPVIKALEDTLDLVDQYASGLADASEPVGELEPLIGHLEAEMKTLDRLESAPGFPAELRSVIHELRVTIGTEIAKFRRGDYA